MTIKKLSILALAIFLPLSMGAQKKKKRVVKKPVIEVPQEDPRITNMREMTQQIIIIDSIVTDKKQFLAHLKLSNETGRVMTTRSFFGNDKADSTSVFLNEMGNKVYFSQPDANNLQQLYTSDKLGNEWSQPQRLKGLSEGISEAAYPFMLTDGITFYFAGKGEESIGGYDIFFTRYNSHNGSFLKPENLGMPFNSEANDYMYAIDEFNHIGYFASDRRQPEGKVCIYVFIPSESRRTYDSALYTEQQLRNLSDISSIADTWGNGAERKAAIARWKQIGIAKADRDNPKTSATHMELIINDALTYSSANDFKSSEAVKHYRQLVADRQKLEKMTTELAANRDMYAKADKAGKQRLEGLILKAEEEVKLLNYRIKQLENQTRNAEIKVIN